MNRSANAFSKNAVKLTSKQMKSLEIGEKTQNKHKIRGKSESGNCPEYEFPDSRKDTIRAAAFFPS